MKWLGLLGSAALLGLAACPVRAEWVARAPAIESKGNLTLPVSWEPGTGLRLRLASMETNGPHVDLLLKPGESAVRFYPEEDAADGLKASCRIEPRNLPAQARSNLVLVLKIRPDAWSLYGDGRPLAALQPAFPTPLRVLQDGVDPGPAPRSRFQKVADFRFDDSFMRPEEDGYPLGEWEPESGDWYLHTAIDTAIDLNTIKPDAKRLLKPEFSPNFYSLATTNRGAAVFTGYGFYDDYTYEAGLRAAPGELGLLFYAQEDGACHGLTLRMEEGADRARLALWACASTNRAAREELGAVEVKLMEGQWVRLGVKAAGSRVQCFLDGVRMLDRPAVLPAGGRFGLYADSPDEVRFDDVSAASTHDLDFEHVADLRRHAVAEKGALLPRKRWLRPLSLETELTRLEPPASREPQWLIVGSPAHGPHVFAADFDTPDLPAAVGLIGGYTRAGMSHYRFVCRRTREGDRYVLERVMGNASKVLEEFFEPAAAGQPRPERLRLMLDATGENAWRCYGNGRLVLVHAPAPDLTGASGLFVDARTRARIGLPEYRFSRGDLYLNRFELNAKFSEDPFMRHWASPEGQWIQETNGLTWCTGDFFGRFALRMPYVEQSQVHLGVGEDGTNGERVVVAREDALFLSSGNDSNVLARSPTNALALEGETKWYVLQHEGNWVWATSGDKLLFKHALPGPFRGRRVRLAGFTADHLKLTQVNRYQVKDFLFKECLYDWIINGGRWEIVNRFQCDPRWSHMNGEGTNSLAAIWAKYEIRGDFCVEMFAGQRMGWYERCGDLNMTVMAKDTSPAQGYTITCTGWDPDHSQLMTRLYRNGRVIAESDKYLAPRRREGNKRLGYEPLVAAGRDVHGAWYYMKFRRIGKKLEFFFDNERVFSVVDEEPLDGGLTGIWTFLNSMMVARVKVAAEEIRPRTPPRIDPAALAPAPAQPPLAPCALLKDGKPLALCRPAFWEADDPVGGLRLAWFRDPEGGDGFEARNRCGSGGMLTRCLLPPVSYDRFAGWRFDLRRTPGARLDFHYAVGRTNAAGVFVPEQRFVHRLSSSEAVKGDIRVSGSTAVPAGEWAPVTVWLPPAWPAKTPDPAYVVQAEGFGLLQPSRDLQGLTGNAPGEAYAVRNFTEIGYGTPQLEAATNGAPPAAFTLLDLESGRKTVVPGSVTGLQAWAAAAAPTGLVRLAVLANGDRRAGFTPLAWIRLPAQPPFQAAWHHETPDAVLFRSPAPYPDRRFQSAPLLLAGMPRKDVAESFSNRCVHLPCEEALTAAVLTASLGLPGFSNAVALAWKDNPRAGAPVLLALEGPTPYFQNGERRHLETMALPLAVQAPALALEPEGQGAYLEVRNTPALPRLRTVLPVTLSLARHPLFQFRYRTPDPMARVSLVLGGNRFARISEAHPTAQTVRGLTAFAADNAWRTWMGQVSDAMSSQQFDARSFLATNPELASANPVDQTGRYSAMDLDDLVFGPAVSSAEKLAFTPRFFDFGGIASVHYAVRKGPEPFASLTPEQRSDLAWTAIPNDARTVPDLSGVPDGIGHLFLKAKSARGRESAVSDLPFLLDRQPLKASFAFGNPDLTTREGAILRVSLETDGAAPVDPETLQMKWDGREESGLLRSTSFVSQPAISTLSFTWPLLFREQLKETANGQKVTLELSGLRDGAGNESPALAIPIAIDYARDKTPPVLMPTAYPTNIGFRSGWDPDGDKINPFTVRGSAAMEFVTTTNEPPFLRVKTGVEGSLIGRIEKGSLVPSFPNLAFRLRRPALNPTNDTVNLTLTVELSTNSLTIPLTSRQPNPKFVALPEPPAWKTSNDWSSVFVDLWKEAGDRGFAVTNLTIKSLTLSQTGPQAEGVFDIDSVYTFHHGSSNDQVRLNPYDASGLGPTVVSYENVAGKELAPAEFLGQPAPNAVPPRGWALLRARDKAGNTALPVRVPAWSVHPPTGGR